MQSAQPYLLSGDKVQGAPSLHLQARAAPKLCTQGAKKKVCWMPGHRLHSPQTSRFPHSIQPCSHQSMAGAPLAASPTPKCLQFASEALSQAVFLALTLFHLKVNLCNDNLELSIVTPQPLRNNHYDILR